MPALDSGSRVAVIGGGPAGSFFSYFLLEMAERVDVDLQIDVYEPRDFSKSAPGGCNMCGGIVSESLVQMLSAEGIPLPPTVIQRGIDSYVLHTDVGSVRVDTPLQEMRIGAVHRGSGPRDVDARGERWGSFDGHLLELARQKGANVVRGRVDDLSWDGGRPCVRVKGKEPATYDLLVGAVGVNTGALKLFEGLGFNYVAPKTTKAYICEFFFGREQVGRYLGNSMHVFLVDLPRLEFAALIPKGAYATMCLLGHEIDKELVEAFLRNPEVRRCFPEDWEQLEPSCHCSPHIYEEAAVQPFADRVVMIGDCSVSRLYKNGIGAAYRTAKSCAVTAMFDGIGAEDFRRHYLPACRKIVVDNTYGRVVFKIVEIMRNLPFSCRAMLRMAAQEQQKEGKDRLMSMVLWDTFTGSAPYSDIFSRAMRPTFLARLGMELARALVTQPVRRARDGGEGCSSDY